MKYTWYTPGEWKVVCDVCGFYFKNTQLRKRWDGLMVCDMDWETRHPQDLIRPVKDDTSLPWTRPDPAAGNPDLISYTEVGYCTATGRQGVAGYGQAGCMAAGIDLGYRDVPDIS